MGLRNHMSQSNDICFSGPNDTHSVVYQNEEGKWVTDLAYYSSFEKEVEAKIPDEVVMQFQAEDFIGGGK